MGILELIFIGIGLSMDAFAVSICKGLGMKLKVNMKQCLLIAVFFGGFQALMPWLGWLLGRQFQRYITSIDHWIAFILLAFLGGKMIIDGIKEGRAEEPEVCPEDEEKLSLKELLLMAVATSIDALAVGVTFAFLQVRIAPSITVIGCITFGFSVAGVFIGSLFGSKFQNKATITGGVILVLIGLKILLEHLAII